MRFFLQALLTLLLTLFLVKGLPASDTLIMPDIPSRMDYLHKTVYFDHTIHKKELSSKATGKELCALCHHEVNTSAVCRQCSSGGCHDTRNPRRADGRAFYQIIHNEKPGLYMTCMSCHKALAGTDAARQKMMTGCTASLCHVE